MFPLCKTKIVNKVIIITQSRLIFWNKGKKNVRTTKYVKLWMQHCAMKSLVGSLIIIVYCTLFKPLIYIMGCLTAELRPVQFN